MNTNSELVVPQVDPPETKPASSAHPRSPRAARVKWLLPAAAVVAGVFLYQLATSLVTLQAVLDDTQAAVSVSAVTVPSAGQGVAATSSPKPEPARH